MHATQRPFSQAAFGSPSGTPAWKTIPSWYLVAIEDRAIPPATQRFMAERAGAHTSEVRSLARAADLPARRHRAGHQGSR